jgi:hypothetical protein
MNHARRSGLLLAVGFIGFGLLRMLCHGSCSTPVGADDDPFELVGIPNLLNAGGAVAAPDGDQ